MLELVKARLRSVTVIVRAARSRTIRGAVFVNPTDIDYAISVAAGQDEAEIAKLLARLSRNGLSLQIGIHPCRRTPRR